MSVFVVRVMLVPWEVAVTVAPTTLDPDWSRTLPEKLPVAWPYIAGDAANASAQAAAIKNTLRHILFGEFLVDFGRPAPIIVRFIVKPLSITSDKVVLCAEFAIPITAIICQ